MEKKIIEIKADIHEENERIAKKVNEQLTAKGVFAVNIMGAPGTGKTSTLIRLINGLKNIKPFVIEGDIESDIDTRTLKALGVETIQINTGGACHLDSPMIEKSVDKLDIKEKGILFIENIGNLVCPAEFVIGEHIKMLICAVTDGSDKPYKYPLAFEKADVIILNKADLKPYTDFDEEFFYKGVKALNKNAVVFEVSAKTGQGFDRVVEWLEKRVG
jgi:hydrogenase nickel incorporation protein HypB